MNTEVLPEKVELRLLATLSAKVTKVIEIGETVYGTMINASFEGTVTGEFISGSMTGVNYALVRPDGVHEVDVRGYITTDDAYLEVLILGSEIPSSGKFMTDGYVKITSAKDNVRYNWLNDTIVIGLGQDLGDDSFTYKYYYYYQ
jgi:hypothetical protein